MLTEEDVAQLAERPRFGIAAQTTQPLENVRHLVALIRRRFPRAEVKFIDTVCRPTKQRQTAAVELALESDVVVVVGGQNSNNTRELAVTCQAHCGRVHHIRSRRSFGRNGSTALARLELPPGLRRRIG